jgi:ankyrin repeat protein
MIFASGVTRRLARACVLLFAAVALLAGCSDPDRPTVPLYLAMQRGDIDQLDRHIFWGADVNSMMPNGKYPLHMAAEKGRLVMVRTLLEHGADIDSRTESGDSALALAILAGRTQVAEVLLAQGAALDPSALLLKAAQQGVTDRDTVRFLIDRGADTEYRSPDGDTALLIAIRQDNHRLATHLVNQGADVNVTTGDGESALALARELRLPELISLLERQGAR